MNQQNVRRFICLILFVSLILLINPSGAHSITSISPTSIKAGSPLFTLTVTGTDFSSSPLFGSDVKWNNDVLSTTYISDTQLTASVPAEKVASAGTVSIVVRNYGLSVHDSNSATFTIYASSPSPAITSISPSSATAGGPEFTLTVQGVNFLTDNKVQWNGVDRTTTYVSSTTLTATILSTDIASAGTAKVRVREPPFLFLSPSIYSNEVSFTINPQSIPVPSITSLIPQQKKHGQAAFNMRVIGTNFNSGCKVLWKGSERTTTFVSPTQLRAMISSTDIANKGKARVKVMNSELKRSNGVIFTIT
ncbi:MAG: IPT/TIG domain-containing protein [Methanomicrobiales archaeon]|nr:IPT/TIG domain-containing protein [Methanomicrobiales archaeon]